MAPDPVTTLVGTTALEKAGELLVTRVVGKWSDIRARRFVQQFIDTVKTNHPHVANAEELEKYLGKIVEDEISSAALYDAFRRVVLAASRDLGPRVLALHMAEVIAGQVDDLEVSDAVMTAAGMLYDFEFEQFLSYAAANGLEDSGFEESCRQVAAVQLSIVEFDSNARDIRQEAGPVNLRREVGSWAAKLEQAGLVVQDLSEREFAYDVDTDRGVDEPGLVRRIYRYLELREGSAHLLRLCRAAVRAKGSA